MIFSFDNIQHCATKAMVTPLFTHFQNKAAPFMYAENFIQFHQVPTLADFIDALAYLKDQSRAERARIHKSCLAGGSRNTARHHFPSGFTEFQSGCPRIIRRNA